MIRTPRLGHSAAPPQVPRYAKPSNPTADALYPDDPGSNAPSTSSGSANAAVACAMSAAIAATQTASRFTVPEYDTGGASAFDMALSADEHFLYTRRESCSRMPPIGKALIAEGIGAFALSFVGVMAISAADLAGATGIANLASIGLAHGLTIGVMIAALGAISGGHFNPAVTFGFVVTGHMPVVTGVMYWVAQLVGAAIAGFLNVGLVGAAAVANGTPDLSPNTSMAV